MRMSRVAFLSAIALTGAATIVLLAGTICLPSSVSAQESPMPREAAPEERVRPAGASLPVVAPESVPDEVAIRMIFTILSTLPPKGWSEDAKTGWLKKYGLNAYEQQLLWGAAHRYRDQVVSQEQRLNAVSRLPGDIRVRSQEEKQEAEQIRNALRFQCRDQWQEAKRSLPVERALAMDSFLAAVKANIRQQQPPPGEPSHHHH
jgi:hypothetical protein